MPTQYKLSKQKSFGLQLSAFLLFASLFFQSHEDGFNQVLFKLNDRLIFIFGALGFIVYGCHLRLKASKLALLIFIFSLYSFSVTVANIPFVEHDSNIEFKYTPVVYMLYYAIALFSIGIIALLANNNNHLQLQTSFNIFGVVSSTFIFAYLLFVFGVDTNWGLDKSYGFPRIQGFMIEPSYSGYVFFLLFCLSQSNLSRLVFLVCVIFSFSVSVYAGVFTYFLIVYPRRALIIMLLTTIVALLINIENNFFLAKFTDVWAFVRYGDINSGNAFRLLLFYDALDFNYSFFGSGLGSPLYVVGSEQTITPNLLMIAYETGFFGLFLFLIIYMAAVNKLNREQLALLSCCFVYWFINGGNILIFWICLVFFLLFPQIKVAGDIRFKF